MLLISAILFTSITSARAGALRPLYASYCVALLEQQTSPDLRERKRILTTLDRYDAQAQTTRDQFERYARVAHQIELRPLRHAGHYVSLFLEKATPPRDPRSLRTTLHLLRQIPERVARLQQDTYAVREGVSARATEIRGRNEILAHLALISAGTERYESSLRPDYEAQRPYVARIWGRFFGGASNTGTFARVRRLIELVSRAEFYPDALVHDTSLRSLDEALMRELKAAATAGRALSLEFARDLQNPSRTFRHIDLPVIYAFKLDLIYFFDHAAAEPVLLIFDRFVRDTQHSGKRKRDAGTATVDNAFGAFKPTGY